MADWRAFTEHVTWFVREGDKVVVGGTRAPTPFPDLVVKQFPKLAQLVASASVTDVVVNNKPYELLAWNGLNGSRLGWLCLAVAARPPENLYPAHELLLTCFGGIVERFNEPEGTWLLNLNDALTERLVSRTASFIENDCAWMFEDEGRALPTGLGQYYSIADEANGNATFCHRQNGHVVMYAHDHCFEHLNPLPGFPCYTLYNIGGANNFHEWVEAVAGQWLGHVVKSA